ncbi:hypothetical protein ACHAW5_005829 [Stephanodiscus triporus]|uniref:Uncharacterized protein n=1 Tax=Stephanodiscus triporus TaxID=2934178 RepID=A0ABD3QMT6_9STRA
MLVDMFHSICSTGRLPSSPPSSHDDDDDGELTTTTTTTITMTPIRGGTTRRHFHEFMLDVHGRIHRHRLVNDRGSDLIPPVAASIARETRLLCLDEMQITDIADAMIMRRLMTLLFDLGVVVAVPVVMGRSITSSKSNDSCATFDFDELCHRPLGAADYIALASRFDTIIVTNVPRLTGVEWSATGRVGVSLAQLSAVREVSFSFRRAESRLAEMASSSWGR